MATAARSFVVYRDDDESNSVQAGSSAAVDKHAPPPPSIILPSAATSLIVFAPDKENINPATGLRSNAEQATKKRKTGVLAVKAQIPPKKKQKESKESKDVKPSKEKDSRKRTAASSTSAIKTRSSSEKKTKRPLSSRKNAAPSRARRSPSLPRVVEEIEAEQDRVAQAVADAKCYELTVLPLADLSQAYEQAPSFEDKLAMGLPNLKDDKEPIKTADTAELPSIIRASTPEPSTADQSDEPQPSIIALCTPERKMIYSAFTFSSPSPTSSRFASARGSSVERFSDTNF